MEETKTQMLENMARQDAQTAHAARHTKKRTRKPKVAPVVEVSVDTTPISSKVAEVKKPRTIRATFHNRESKGAPLRFSFNNTRYHFKDGEECEMPVRVYKHLNNLARTVPLNRVNEDGFTPHADIKRKEPRFAVIPIIYDGEEDLYNRKPVYTVQY